MIGRTAIQIFWPMTLLRMRNKIFYHFSAYFLPESIFSVNLQPQKQRNGIENQLKSGVFVSL